MYEKILKTGSALATYTVRYYRAKKDLDANDSPVNRLRARSAYADMMDVQEEMARMARELANERI